MSGIKRQSGDDFFQRTGTAVVRYPLKPVWRLQSTSVALEVFIDDRASLYVPAEVYMAGSSDHSRKRFVNLV